MTRTFIPSALAASAVLSLSLLAGAAAAQDYCPHCRGGGIHGPHGHVLHPHPPNQSPYDGSLVGAGHGPYNNLGNCNYRNYAAQDLFYNYYVGNNCGGMGAQLYLSPRPVPPFVGHTYITYQPLMPHEFMYAHHRTYHRYYNGGQGLTRTSVHYSAPIFRH
jgi:hypothetical protein